MESVPAGGIDATANSRLCLVAEFLNSHDDPVDFDLAGVTFMDKAGWAAICSASGMARRAGVNARVVNPSPSVMRLTDLLRAAHRSRGRNAGPSQRVPVA
jgi:anti-anti-sigma regulatory factor